MFRIVRNATTALLAVSVCAIAALFAAYYVPDPGADAPQVLVSVDRTLWNTVRLNRLSYIRQLRLAGLRPYLAPFPPNGANGWSALPEGIHGLLLTGGGDVAASEYGGDAGIVQGVKPARDAFEIRLLELAERDALPVLGLCRGAQLLNVFRGGTLGDFRHDRARHARHRNVTRGHDVQLVPDSRLAEIYGSTLLEDVTTWHGQHVARPGRNLNIAATAPDGTPEAIEDRTGERFVMGVQWHAEMPPWNNRQAPLFDAFASAVRLRSQAGAAPSTRRQDP